MSRSSNINILDRPLGGRGSRSQSNSEVSLSAFCYLYSELVQYHQNRVDSISELERKLESSGYGIGFKVLELLAYRNKENKREIRLMSILQFVSTQCWKALFNKPADSLERSIDHSDEYMIIDYNPITSTYIRKNRNQQHDLGGLSVDAFISGIIAGILQGSGFPARVTAHTVPLEEAEIHEWKQYMLAHGGSQGGPGLAGGVTGAVASGSSYTGALAGYGGGGGSSSSGAGTSFSQYLSMSYLPPRKEKTVFLVKFNPEVLRRDEAMDR